METNGDGEDGDETEENDGVNENWGSASLHIPEFYDSTSRWNLKEQSWCQQHEQYHCDHYRSPVRHCFDAREREEEEEVRERERESGWERFLKSFEESETSRGVMWKETAGGNVTCVYAVF